jgi:hypothetical protein
MEDIAPKVCLKVSTLLNRSPLSHYVNTSIIIANERDKSVTESVTDEIQSRISPEPGQGRSTYKPKPKKFGKTIYLSYNQRENRYLPFHAEGFHAQSDK